MERIIEEKSNNIAFLLQQKGSLHVKEPMGGSTHAPSSTVLGRSADLKSVGSQGKRSWEKDSWFEFKTRKSSKIKGDEQKTRVRKAEHPLKVAEEEMLMAKLKAASISEELVKVHRWWVPRWLAVHLCYFQSYIVTHWNDHGRPALDFLIQKA